MAEIVSFYSYKGGVGRSLALANIAVLLAQRGRRVVCIDFDIEAGGLHTIFGLEPEHIRETMLDLITKVTSPDVKPALVDLTHLLPSRNADSRLWLLPSVYEIEKVKDALDTGLDLANLLGRVINNTVSLCNPHFIFVDSRSGFAELASAPILNADRLVCVLRPNWQNADGLRMLLDILDTVGARLKTFIVLSQVPDVPEAAAKIEKLQNLLGAGRQFDALIPYAPELALDENVLAISAPESHLARCYLPVAEWLEK